MSIVSGISTASGIAPLLNAPRETNQVTRVGQQSDAAAARPTSNNQSDLSGLETKRPVGRLKGDANSGQFPDIRTSSDVRYARFVEAVQALRRDPEEPVLNDKRVAELIAAAEDFFLVDDGIPREVQPLPADASVLIKPPEIIPPLEQIDPLADAIKGAQNDSGAVLGDAAERSEDVVQEKTVLGGHGATGLEFNEDEVDRTDKDRQQEKTKDIERTASLDRPERREPEVAELPQGDDPVSNRRDAADNPGSNPERRAESDSVVA